MTPTKESTNRLAGHKRRQKRRCYFLFGLSIKLFTSFPGIRLSWLLTLSTIVTDDSVMIFSGVRLCPPLLRRMALGAQGLLHGHYQIGPGESPYPGKVFRIFFLTWVRLVCFSKLAEFVTSGVFVLRFHCGIPGLKPGQLSSLSAVLSEIG